MKNMLTHIIFAPGLLEALQSKLPPYISGAFRHILRTYGVYTSFYFGILYDVFMRILECLDSLSDPRCRFGHIKSTPLLAKSPYRVQGRACRESSYIEGIIIFC